MKNKASGKAVILLIFIIPAIFLSFPEKFHFRKRNFLKYPNLAL